ncbi:MAG: aldo/keto reductase [Chloroflexi bacterium]|nr:MAG: aldo/keto reductase [Chloroflexota bacterium]
MERRRLGRAALEVPVIGMGTWQTFDTAHSRQAVVEEALMAGIDLFDSSPMYGRAEDVLARALTGRRGEAMIATKIWTRSEAEGREQAQHALRLYGRVEIYQVHNLVAWKSQLRMLEQLKADGQVTAVGATHYLPSAFDDLCDVMQTGRLDMIQLPYNPRLRDAERRVLPLAAELGIGVLVHSPLRFGVLEHRPDPGLLNDLGVKTWAQAILKWIASDPRISCVLTATKTPGRPTENAAAGNAPFLNAEQRERIAAEINA